MEEQELIELIKSGREARNIEYKRSMPWTNKENRHKIIRTILSMSNIRDGGFIVIGMERQGDDIYVAKGILSEHKVTYIEDKMADMISEFADPYVHFTIQTVNYEDKEFLIIQINEFEEIPVICKKDGYDLVRGKVYTRSRRKPESIEVPSQSEMREILEVAIDKGIRRFFSRLTSIGIEFGAQRDKDRKLFDEEIRDLIDE